MKFTRLLCIRGAFHAWAILGSLGGTVIALGLCLGLVLNLPSGNQTGFR